MRRAGTVIGRSRAPASLAGRRRESDRSMPQEGDYSVPTFMRLLWTTLVLTAATGFHAQNTDPRREWVDPTASHETGFQYGDLNHLQFNPVDPNVLLYCHEGTWHEVDRTWTIRTDGTAMRLVHKRTMDMEINGHEWWSWDGRTVWFDLQTPRSQVFWLAGVDIQSGRQTRYRVERDWWGVHFNSSRDDTLFASDGGDPSQVAYSSDGMWINLFRVRPDGTLSREKLVDMSRHNYVTGRGGVEPNVHITPDHKWVIFTGQFGSGERHVYAVEIRASDSRPQAP